MVMTGGWFIIVVPPTNHIAAFNAIQSERTPEYLCFDLINMTNLKNTRAAQFRAVAKLRFRDDDYVITNLNSDQILRAVNNWEVTRGAELVGVGPDFIWAY